MEHENKIIIVDSLMGTGKTTKMLDIINNDNDNKYMFITPYLKEVDRIKRSTTKNFYEPKNEVRTKYADIMSHLHRNNNIVSTHRLFMDFNGIIENLIVAGDYILVLDEVTTPIKLHSISKHDMKELLNNNLISVDEDGFIVWNPEKHEYEGVFSWMKYLAMKNCLMVYGKDLTLDENCKLVVWSYPKEIFKAFKKVYILTYMFDGCLLKPYFELHNIAYQHCTLDNHLNIVQYSKDIDFSRRKGLRELINVCDRYKLNHIGEEDTALSKTWFIKNPSALPILKRNMSNYFKNVVKAKQGDALWTIFKDYKDNVKGKGYSYGYLECNARAVNDYINTNKLAYCLNRYENPLVVNYFAKHGIKLDECSLAISELLQWAWRSQIRDYKPIHLYLPSKRMRKYLNSWLDCKDAI